MVDINLTYISKHFEYDCLNIPIEKKGFSREDKRDLTTNVVYRNTTLKMKNLVC